MARKRPGIYAALSAYYFDDVAIMGAGENAELLYIRMLAYAARMPEMNGCIPAPVIAYRLGFQPEDALARAQRLTDFGLLEVVEGGYVIRSWARWNKTAEELGMETKQPCARTDSPAPVEPAPVETAPVEPAPVETAPVEPAPVETAPVTPTTDTPVSVTPVTVEAVRVEPAPVEVAPVTPVADTFMSVAPAHDEVNLTCSDGARMDSQWDTPNGDPIRDPNGDPIRDPNRDPNQALICTPNRHPYRVPQSAPLSGTLTATLSGTLSGTLKRSYVEPFLVPGSGSNDQDQDQDQDQELPPIPPAVAGGTRPADCGPPSPPTPPLPAPPTPPLPAPPTPPLPAPPTPSGGIPEPPTPGTHTLSPADTLAPPCPKTLSASQSAYQTPRLAETQSEPENPPHAQLTPLVDAVSDTNGTQDTLPTMPPTPTFDDFWNIYPRHAAKDRARKAWKKALTRTTAHTIIEGATRYRNDPNRDPTYTKHPATWLNAGCWDDDPLPPRHTPHTTPTTTSDRINGWYQAGQQLAQHHATHPSTWQPPPHLHLIEGALA